MLEGFSNKLRDYEGMLKGFLEQIKELRINEYWCGNELDDVKQEKRNVHKWTYNEEEEERYGFLPG